MRYTLPEEFHVFGFAKDLLDWYDAQKRDLPWRINRDPYRVWVSEIMLQQTRVDTVKPYYANFMEKFPTVQALAEASEEDVLKAWEGLGYYSRVRNLQAAAREVQERYGGVVPKTPEEIRTLKGVGPYTAGAILSIAYEKPEPAVDGNVMRVYSRLLYLTDDIAKPATRIKIEHLVRQVIPEGRAGDFNQALMELGAMVCSPRSPQCLTCPVFDYCIARREGVQEELPNKGKAKPPRPVHLQVALIVRDGAVMINKRPEQGLLAGMWEFPMVETDVESEAAKRELVTQQMNERFGVEVEVQERIGEVQHTFSHLQWNMQVWLCDWISGDELPPTARFAAVEELDDYTFPVAHHKIRPMLDKK
ncbi:MULTISPECIES: A/G-specific adenine glycosylase [Brevibacillus]|uniref:A/G-specific adenine glycosylase n=1 Tax=Brevibacillus TaxID=55080 RepID=UPI00203E44D7|nr:MULTISPECIES: A/G-specific adenine glycosylase [Brevibacillus]MCM3080370.1 A/G-specific adenine glycosylase [Brevibacillus invocatus]MCM3430549.1 A/G-specific adenine glycosylase [Brevibacillus invocatus]MDH4616432.1 A/G-specific adenine glycosylase [Brevibacillus sp. AY1]